MKDDFSGRRSMLSGMGVAAAAFTLGASAACAQAQTPAPISTGFQPMRHPQDEWMDALPGQHRVMVDCATVSGAGEGILYANNLYAANQSGYDIPATELATVVCLRHFATPFAYNDAVWEKYGKAISDMLQFTDPMTGEAPTTNLLNSSAYGMALPNMGNTIGSVADRGTQFAVCDMATHFIAGQVAMATGGDADALYEEFTSNLIPNSHMVAAGVVAVTRAQELGYSVLTAL